MIRFVCDKCNNAFDEKMCCPYCGSATVHTIENSDRDDVIDLFEDSKKNDDINKKYIEIEKYSKVVKHSSAKGENKGHRYPIIILSAAGLLTVLGIVFLIIAAVRLKEAERLRNDQINTEAVNTESTTSADEKPELTGISMYVRLDNAYGNRNASLFYTFSNDGEVLKTRNTAVFYLDVRPVPADADIPEVEWSVSDTTYFELSGNRVKMLLETKELTTLPKITAKTKDGRHSITIDVEINHAGWSRIGDHQYFIRGNEEMLKNQWWEDTEKKRYVNNEGIAVTGWQKITDENGRTAIYHFKEKNGNLDTNQDIELKNSEGENAIVHVNADGEAYDSWLYLDGKKYYCNGDGEMLKDTTMESYVFDAEGALVEE